MSWRSKGVAVSNPAVPILLPGHSSNRLGMLPGGEERVLRRAGQRPGQDLQHTFRGLHVDTATRGHRTERLTANGALREQDLAEVADRQMMATEELGGVADPFLKRRPARPRA